MPNPDEEDAKVNVKAGSFKRALLSTLIIASLMVILLLAPLKTAGGQEIGWVRQFGASENKNDWAYDVAVDSLGNVYMAGYTEGALLGQENLGSSDAFVRKYDDSWNEIWTRQFGTSDYDWAYSVAVDGSGNVYVAGNTMGAFPGQTSSGDQDAFLVKFVQPASAPGPTNWPLIAGVVAIILVIGVVAVVYMRRR
jgi:hypothetical protein